MIYIKRICKQDLIKEIAIPSYNAADAFDYDSSDISLSPRDITLNYSVQDSLNCKGTKVKLNIHVPGNGRGDEAGRGAQSRTAQAEGISPCARRLRPQSEKRVS